MTQLGSQAGGQVGEHQNLAIDADVSSPFGGMQKAATTATSLGAPCGKRPLLNITKAPHP